MELVVAGVYPTLLLLTLWSTMTTEGTVDKAPNIWYTTHLLNRIGERDHPLICKLRVPQQDCRKSPGKENDSIVENVTQP
jgi:hypothetical protein